LNTHTRLLSGGLLGMAMVAGCHAPPSAADLEAQRAMLALLMPARIEIVEPFTRVKSFDQDDTPDGIELFLRAVNALDNPGLMIVGQVRVELYQYVPASADPKGARLVDWTVDLSTRQQQQMFWNQLTQMYELRLGLDPATIPPASRYVLLVTYRSPLGEVLTDDFVIQQPSGPRAAGSPR